MPQWISRELFVGSGKKYETETVRGKDVFVALPTGQTTTKRFFYAGIFQWVKGLHDGIVLVVSLLVAIMKDQVALLEEQMVNISFAWHDRRSTALHLYTNYPNM